MASREDFDRCVEQLGDPPRARPAYSLLVAGGPAALLAVRAGLQHESGAVRAGCAEALDHLVDEASFWRAGTPPAAPSTGAPPRVSLARAPRDLRGTR